MLDRIGTRQSRRGFPRGPSDRNSPPLASVRTINFLVPAPLPVFAPARAFPLIAGLMAIGCSLNPRANKEIDPHLARGYPSKKCGGIPRKKYGVPTPNMRVVCLWLVGCWPVTLGQCSIPVRGQHPKRPWANTKKETGRPAEAPGTEHRQTRQSSRVINPETSTRR